MRDLIAIDISKWQPRIDAVGLKSVGVQLIIAKSSQGIFEDAKFRQHADAIVAAGISLAVYHWNDPIIPSLEQAQYCLNVIKDYPVRFIALDIEQWWKSWQLYYQDRANCPYFTAEQIGKHVKETFAALSQAGLPVIAYTSPGFVAGFCPKLFTEYLIDEPAWIAQYIYAYQPPGGKAGVTIHWEELKARYLPPLEAFPASPDGVKRVVGWQWTGDRWCLPYVYALETGNKLSALDINLFEREWLENCPHAPDAATVVVQPPALVSAPERIVITTSNLNVRSAPAIAPNTERFKATKGQTFDVERKVGDWYQIKLFVHQDYVTKE